MEDLKQKEIRLRKELSAVRTANANVDRVVKRTKDMSMGLPTDTSHKPIPTSSDNPDVILLPAKKHGKKENQPF